MTAYTSTLVGQPTAGQFAKGDTFTDVNGTLFTCVQGGQAAPAGYVISSPAVFSVMAKPQSFPGDMSVVGTTSFSATDAITAFATGGQASAVALTTDFNRITVCATAGDSVKLPAAAKGREVCVANFGAKAADVFPATGDAINQLAVNLAVRQNSGATVWYACHVAGTWVASLDVPKAKFTTRALSSSAANAGDLTGAAFVTLTNTGATPGTLTTRTGAQMVADGFYSIGDSYMVRIVNGQGTGTLTLAAGDGNVTLTGTATMAINTFRDFVVTITGVNTLTMQNVGTGSFS